MINKNKILLIAKNLKKFDIDELFSLLNFDNKNIIINCLDELIKSGNIKKIDNDYYMYIYKEKLVRNDSIYFPPKIDLSDYKLIRSLLKQINYEDFTELFQKAPFWVRERVVKNLVLLQESNGLVGNNLNNFIKKWNEINPELKTNYSYIYSLRKNLLKNSYIGILKYCCYYNDNKYFSNYDLYIKFVDLYLKPGAPSLEECVDQLKKEYFDNRINSVQNFPDYHIFSNRLKREYKKIEIEFYRDDYILKETEKIKNIARNYLNSHEFNNVSRNAKAQFTSIIINHIIPYYGNLELQDLTPDIIEKYKHLKFDLGFKSETIKTQVDLLKLIINQYIRTQFKTKLQSN